MKNLHIYAVIIVMLSFISVGSCHALAQQQPLMSPVSGSGGSAGNGSTNDAQKLEVDHLYLDMYEALGGDLSSCAGNQGCISRAENLKSIISCTVDVCRGEDKSKRLIDCFDHISIKSQLEQDHPEVIEQTNLFGCGLIKHPGTATSKDLSSHIPKGIEHKLVEFGAYLLAQKGSAEACEDYIKDYVGPYGPQWKYQWYRAMAGCRILANERTRGQEEKDFHTWFGVVMGTGSCSDIVNLEMRDACSASGATSPIYKSRS